MIISRVRTYPKMVDQAWLDYKPMDASEQYRYANEEEKIKWTIGSMIDDLSSLIIDNIDAPTRLNILEEVRDHIQTLINKLEPEPRIGT